MQLDTCFNMAFITIVFFFSYRKQSCLFRLSPILNCACLLTSKPRHNFTQEIMEIMQTIMALLMSCPRKTVVNTPQISWKTAADKIVRVLSLSVLQVILFIRRVLPGPKRLYSKGQLRIKMSFGCI